MKKLWKKANRGLLLTSVVLTILVIYIVTDYISFRSEKETIRQTVNDYYTEIYQINTKFDGNVDTHKKDIEKIVDSYWSYTDPSTDWVTTKSDMISNINYLFEDIKNGASHNVSQVDSKITSMKISKTGPGYAKVTLSYTTTITGSPDSYAMTPSSYRIIDDAWYSYSEDSEVDTEKLKKQTCLLTYTARDAVIEMHKEDGVWKICGIDAYDYDSSAEYVEEN